MCFRDDLCCSLNSFVPFEYFYVAKRIVTCSTNLTLTLIRTVKINFVVTISPSMLSVNDSFISKPSTSGLKKLKRMELVEIADHYKLTMSSLMKKDDIHRVVLEYLHKEELISDEGGDDG